MGQRRTGRTTRMVEHAIQLARQNRPSVLVFNSGAEARHWERHIYQTEPIALRSIHLTETREINIDWGILTAYDHPTRTLLLDHYVVERKFQRAFAVWAQFDLPEVESRPTPPKPESAPSTKRRMRLTKT